METRESLKKILVVDDEKIARENLAHILKKEGYHPLLAKDGNEAIRLMKDQEIDLVVTDLRMKGKGGMEVLEATKELWPAAEVLIITGYASIDNAVDAMKKGAYYYFAKPLNVQELLTIIPKALERSAMHNELRRLRKQVSEGEGTLKIVGRSTKTLALREQISQVAQLDCNVLILGETGTGKELVAKTIHELSHRSNKRFVALNCGVFTEELIGNELFGHEQGAFTGADKTHKGLLECAEGGTVFFDEIGEMSLQLQVQLLRVLQERTVMRIGGSKEIPVDIRVLAATNKDLKDASETGSFRKDLYYRLNVMTIQVPSLAERRNDIPLLANHFLHKHVEPGRKTPQLSDMALERLKGYEYPGNVRELENIMQRLLITCREELIEPHHIMSDIISGSVADSEYQGALWPTLEEHEKKYILEVLEEVEGKKSEAAKILGIDRVSLWRKIKRYGLAKHDL
ncbi:sigma-54 dependent transcriptional regulator [Desulfopila sp. IMCC35008]|uniref:sigma-54-dependent transcriptional regulator n=1 Tax=Desulfopila sp. IMCC35008 TaxID=2653858 RepID=UPI0013D48160|nr:sigma-54 dependent transcriptional regulator [Desulfopila sp. IMCC35008]